MTCEVVNSVHEAHDFARRWVTCGSRYGLIRYFGLLFRGWWKQHGSRSRSGESLYGDNGALPPIPGRTGGPCATSMDHRFAPVGRTCGTSLLLRPAEHLGEGTAFATAHVQRRGEPRWPSQHEDPLGAAPWQRAAATRRACNKDRWARLVFPAAALDALGPVPVPIDHRHTDAGVLAPDPEGGSDDGSRRHWCCAGEVGRDCLSSLERPRAGERGHTPDPAFWGRGLSAGRAAKGAVGLRFWL